MLSFLQSLTEGAAHVLARPPGKRQAHRRRTALSISFKNISLHHHAIPMPRQPVILAACMLFAVCSIAASQQPPLPPSVSAVLASEDNPFLADDPPPPIPSDVISAQTQQTAQTDGIEQQQPQAEAEQEGGEATDAAEAPQAAPTLPTPTEPASNEDPCGCSTTGPDGNSTFAGCGQWLASQGSNAFVCYVNDPNTCPEAIILEPSSLFPGKATKSCTAEQAVMEGTLPTLEQLLSTLLPQASEFYALSSSSTTPGLPSPPPPRGDKTILVPSNEALNAAYTSGQLSKPLLQENAEEAARVVASHTLPSGSIQAQSLGALGEVRTAAGNALQTSIGAATGRLFVDGVVILVPDLLATDGIVHVIGGVLPVSADGGGELVVASPPPVPAPSPQIPQEPEQAQAAAQEEPARAETLPPPPSSAELPEGTPAPPITTPPGLFPPAIEVIHTLPQTDLPRQQTDGAIQEDQRSTAPPIEVEGSPPMPEPATVYSNGLQERDQQEPQDVQGTGFTAPAPETEESQAVGVETPQTPTEIEAEEQNRASQPSSSDIDDAEIVSPPPQSIAATSQQQQQQPQQQQTVSNEPRRPSRVIENGVVDLNIQGDSSRETTRPSSLSDVFASISRQAQGPLGQSQIESASTIMRPDSGGGSRSSVSSSLAPIGVASSVAIDSDTTSDLLSSRGGGFENCECSADGISGGVRTGMRGCERRLGEQFRLLPFPFCYVDPSCPLSSESVDFPGAAWKIC